jgi:hypothetical protein
MSNNCKKLSMKLKSVDCGCECNPEWRRENHIDHTYDLCTVCMHIVGN